VLTPPPSGSQISTMQHLDAVSRKFSSLIANFYLGKLYLSHFYNFYFSYQNRATEKCILRDFMTLREIFSGPKIIEISYFVLLREQKFD